PALPVRDGLRPLVEDRQALRRPRARSATCRVPRPRRLEIGRGPEPFSTRGRQDQQKPRRPAVLADLPRLVPAAPPAVELPHADRVPAAAAPRVRRAAAAGGAQGALVTRVPSNGVSLVPVPIGGRAVGPGWPCFVVAEAGVNHNGELELARRLVDAAAAAGVDAVKFQAFRSEGVAAPVAAKAGYQLETMGGGESQ